MYGSLVTFEPAGVNMDKLRQLASQRKIWMVGGQRIRVSTHIHTRPSDIDLLFQTIADART
jgi:selenocysteine lyase/cysteine desulfurase